MIEKLKKIIEENKKENLEKTRIRDNLRYQEDFNFRMKKVLRTRMNKKIKRIDGHCQIVLQS